MTHLAKHLNSMHSRTVLGRSHLRGIGARDVLLGILYEGTKQACFCRDITQAIECLFIREVFQKNGNLKWHLP